ncbi:lysozyme [Paraburkholderia caballeronis]|nr:lysozyme [Paraburkholderia caballeronis]TDV09615.1 lysozyme [Paraburkholderia caballeronis]TDV21680.1 lysozyme [Paraburkholderia caballeronis]
MTEHFEGCRLTAYQDVGGVWTIGYGCTGTGIAAGVTWTAEHAESQLVLRLNETADDVDRLVKVEINAAQKAALVDFAYNLGVGALGTSTLLRLLNASDFVAAANQFGEWVLAAGKPQPGLITRRAAEKRLFTTGAWQS